jgi:hypothetical protein
MTLEGLLELRTEEGKYYLAGRPLEAGCTLEILLAEDRWLCGRYEWTGTLARWPSLRIDLGVRQGTARTTALPIPPDAVLRWKK